MKKKLLTLAVLAICAASIASGTLAYYTAQERAHNVITTGGVEIEIIEKTKDDTGKEIDFPQNGVIGVMPGMSIYKMVKIQNSGGGEAWIRAKVESSIADASGNPMPLTFGTSGTAVLEYKILDGWSDGGDGYYYYEKPVSSGDSTSLLMDLVEFNSALGNEYQNCKADIVISAQAVQTANNGTKVTEAKGWPQN